jgi:hypothetical protein
LSSLDSPYLFQYLLLNTCLYELYETQYILQITTVTSQCSRCYIIKILYNKPLPVRVQYIRDCPYEFNTAPPFSLYLVPLLHSVKHALGPNHPRIRWVPGPISQGIKGLLLKADNSPPSSAEVKNGGSTRIPPHPTRLRGVVPN